MDVGMQAGTNSFQRVFIKGLAFDWLICLISLGNGILPEFHKKHDQHRVFLSELSQYISFSYSILLIMPGLSLGDTKPLPEPVLTYNQRYSVAFIWEQLHKEGSWT